MANPNTLCVRPATLVDADSVAAIYAPYVADTAISFELAPPSGSEMRGRMADLVSYPFLVAVTSTGDVFGYAYASPHRQREAYRFCVETSVYISQSSHRRGVGTALYTRLLAELREAGYVNAYAGITLPNPASVGFHAHFGFEKVGVYHGVGYKFQAWHDVGWWELRLNDRVAVPREPALRSA